ncbi:MAG: hypothetical protein ACFCU6_12850 [Balneolaceae bacterium]
MAVSNILIERRKNILGCTPVFNGTRVTVSTFFDPEMGWASFSNGDLLSVAEE